MQFGDGKIFPNIYCMIIGEPGSRKSTAIKKAVALLSASGYDKFSADKSTKEKFLLDLEGLTPDEGQVGASKAGAYGKNTKQVYDSVMASNLWGDDTSNREAKEVFIAADEFNEFAGTGNLEFFSLLGALWDWDREDKGYTSRLKNSRSVDIYQPTINILGGITPEQFALTFPPAIIGQGFLSRMIFIHGERSERQYTIPPTPDPVVKDKLIRSLQVIRSKAQGGFTVATDAFEILDKIYRGWEDIDDVRFRSYSNRRFIQLLKLCIIVQSCEEGTDNQISVASVIRSNTILSAAEHFMPTALGEFGKSKNSDVVNKVMALLYATSKPLTVTDLWKHVQKDLDKPTQLGEMMQSLQLAGKVQNVKGKGWLPLRKVGEAKAYVDWSLLTQEEQKGLGE